MLTNNEKSQINFLNVQANFKSFLLDWCEEHDKNSRPILLKALLQTGCIIDPENKTVINLPKNYDKTDLINHKDTIIQACEALKVQYWKEVNELTRIPEIEQMDLF